jgi:RNA 2',3'-cyclic 3'-phosphodiesterase
VTADGPPAPAKAIRAFVALPLPDTLRAGVARTIALLEPSLPEARFARGEGLHVTLRFLGWTRPEVLASLEDPLRAAASACPPFDVAVGGLGMFPDRGRPRVLWLGLSLPREAHALQAACERAAVAAGFEAEARPFRPHLTLARWRDRASRPTLPDVFLGTARVDHLVLYRSDPRAGGSVYTPLTVLPLAGSAAR